MVLGNFFDGFRIIWGILQSFCRLVSDRPDVIFLKGGYVCLPVGIVAGFLKIPYVIHDSDAAPGLTNRVLAKKAKIIATGMPLNFYKYPEGRAVWTGIPIAEKLRSVNKTNQRRAKRELGFDDVKPLLVVTGGSLGALHINEAIAKILPELLKKCSVALISGHESYEGLKYLEGKFTDGFKLIEFTTEMEKYFAAADVVVSRSGASTMSELASMKKAVVLVPNHKLPGFHQVKNAENYVEAGAALLVRDKEQGVDDKELLKAICKLLSDEALRAELSKKLGGFAKNDAAVELAKLVLAAAR
jgi:UDP-N-acetylglucosamine--N-acetylmuramyl-(pentapeptide) pyrophosphoryl-undecaprenol N-acetylglucosamine transferase